MLPSKFFYFFYLGKATDKFLSGLNMRCLILEEFRVLNLRDWWHNFINLGQSAILRDISSPVLAISSWATIISFVHRYLLKSYPTAARYICIPSTMHSLMVSALGLLLVFRTNSAYQRFVVSIFFYMSWNPASIL